MPDMTHHQPSAEPTVWALGDQLAARETTHRGYLWFVNPVNSAWVPLFTASQLAAEIERAVAAERARCVQVCRELADLYTLTLQSPDMAKGAEGCAVAVGNLAPRKTMEVSDGC